MSDDLGSEPLMCWPGGWPGRQVVELGNLSNPGFWLEERLAEIEQALQGDDAALEDAANLLTDDYIAEAAKIRFPLPSDFGVDDVACREKIKSEFRAFLLEWSKTSGRQPTNDGKKKLHQFLSQATPHGTLPPKVLPQELNATDTKPNLLRLLTNEGSARLWFIVSMKRTMLIRHIVHHCLL